jgi:two-component system, OmpR family, sensor histidine kinase ArlS
MTLKNKINLSTAVMFIILLIIIHLAIYFAFSRMTMNSEMERVLEEAKQAAAGIHQSDSSVPVQQLLLAYVPVNGLLQIVKADGNKGAAAESAEEWHLRKVPVTYFGKEEKNILTYKGASFAFVSLPIVWQNGEVVDLQLTVSLQSTDEMLQLLRLLLVSVILIATIPVLISSRLLGNFITRPITSMIRTMKEIQRSGHFKRLPLPRKTNDELYQMGEAFNKMIDLLEVNYQKQGAFISNASHELKTPLTVIESYANLLRRRGKGKPEVFDESVHAILTETERMRDLTQTLLLLAKHDEQWKMEIEKLELTPLVQEISHSFKNAYQRPIELTIDEHLIVEGDKQRVKQLVYIFLDNARKYSDDQIELRTFTKGQNAVLEIKDYGIGIPANQLDKVFDRFYRVDEARERKTGGFGLGLSLAHELAEAMDVTLHMESNEGHGTTVQILFKSLDSQ